MHPDSRQPSLLCNPFPTQWLTCDKQNPTIMDTAMEYPQMIIFRVAQMYPLFITFLELLFIKWWLDSFPLVSNSRLMVIAGTIGLAGYGLFVSCIDRKRINYVLAGKGVLVAGVGSSVCIAIIMANLKNNRDNGLHLRSESSWFWKKLFAIGHWVGIVLGFLIYLGEFDIKHKPMVEYLTVFSTSLFYATFAIDFANFKMDIEEVFTPS